MVSIVMAYRQKNCFQFVYGRILIEKELTVSHQVMKVIQKMLSLKINNLIEKYLGLLYSHGIGLYVIIHKLVEVEAWHMKLFLKIFRVH